MQSSKTEFINNTYNLNLKIECMFKFLLNISFLRIEREYIILFLRVFTCNILF